MSIKTHVPQKPVGTREWYEFIALVADAGLTIHVGGEEATTALIKMLDLTDSDHVLDVGTGPGVTAIRLARDIGARVTGIDISQTMLDKAMARAEKEGVAEQCRFQVGDVLDLSFEDETFDAVLFESLLTVIPGDPGDATTEMMRVLRPGGRIGGNEGTIDPAAVEGIEPLLEQHPAIQRTYTPESLRAQFEAVGLEAIQMRTVSAGDAPSLDTSRMIKELGVGGLFSFFTRTYPKLVKKLLFDPRFRRAHRVDEQVTKRSKEYMGYTLIVGRKPSTSPAPSSVVD